MTIIELVLFLLRALIIVLGGVISYFAYRAYRRTNAAPLRALAGGFALVTLGSFLAAVAHQLTGLAFPAVSTINAAFTATGFAIILYSLYIQ